MRFILVSTLIAQIFKVAYERTAFWTTGECRFASDNDLVENILYFLNEPVQVMVQISCFLYIFWRKRLLNEGASQFLQVNNGGLSFVNPATTQGAHAYQKAPRTV